jgi:hypothetical protein
MRDAFPDFHAEIHWQLADGDRVTTYKTYHGTHEEQFLGIAPTHRTIHFESVDVMRVQNGKITDHWGVGNLLSLMRQIGGWPPHLLRSLDRRQIEAWFSFGSILKGAPSRGPSHSRYVELSSGVWSDLSSLIPTAT